MNNLSKKLYTWFQSESQNYPWRLNSTPYSIWISEIMLQQTQASTVIPYFNKWIEIYPSLDHLKTAKFDHLIKLWEGLGYYKRVNYIYNSSKIINVEHNNKMPMSYENLIKLPGIGDYTASAILSIAFNQAYPAIDGNLKRVLSRINTLNIQNQKLKIFKSFASTYYSKYNPGIINQSLMDLGRLICTFKNPKCNICPINNYCNAYKTNTIALYPTIKTKKKLPMYNVVVGLIIKKNKFLISKRKSTGLLANLWELPGGKKKRNETDLDCLRREIKEETDITIANPYFIGTIKHQYSHFKININLFKCEYDSGKARSISSQKIKWIFKKNINQFTFPSATHKLFQLLDKKNESYL